jgi:hypothetical protein
VIPGHALTAQARRPPACFLLASSQAGAVRNAPEIVPTAGVATALAAPAAPRGRPSEHEYPTAEHATRKDGRVMLASDERPATDVR